MLHFYVTFRRQKLKFFQFPTFLLTLYLQTNLQKHVVILEYYGSAFIEDKTFMLKELKSGQQFSCNYHANRCIIGVSVQKAITNNV